MSARALLGALIVVLGVGAWGGGLRADPTADAQAAVRDLLAAIDSLQNAQARPDRVMALSQTILAYEDGLAALRENLRPLSLREAQIAAGLAARDSELSQMLGVLLAASGRDDESLLVHPDGALAAARAAMLLGDVIPALASQSRRLADELDELRDLRKTRSFAVNALESGLIFVQDARAALARAIDERGPLPRRLAEDADALAALARDAGTLDAFARSLAGQPVASDGAVMVSLGAARGMLPLPVRGTLLREFGASDAAGIARPGLVLATTAGALVTAPWSATVRYAGPLAGQGQLVILEPDEDRLMVLSGLGDLYVSTGEVVPQGAPLGAMPLGARAATELPAGQSLTGSLDETLYFEFRQGGEPIDPEPWFALTGR